ncbi:hypothetical protein [Actinopolymorpha alba]|uniref:hypothetical protein n=1 Tax=Actinopolymorpha alba TaxID=533267 RepID=UPI000381C941|nr:hypothetical protein [Actinopolymorpha alba]
MAATPTVSARTTADAEELAEHLTRVLESRLFDPLEILLDNSSQLEQLRRKARRQADTWAAELLGPDDLLATQTLIRLVSTLFPSDTAFDPPAEWWQTPLGQVTARRVGHPTAAAVTYAVAGAMLGMTRQGVHDLIRRGKLAKHPDGGVTVASVRERLRQR